LKPSEIKESKETKKQVINKKVKNKTIKQEQKKRNLWSGIDEPSRGSEGGAGRSS